VWDVTGERTADAQIPSLNRRLDAYIARQVPRRVFAARYGGGGGDRPTFVIQLTVHNAPSDQVGYALQLVAPDATPLICHELTDSDGDGVYVSGDLANPRYPDGVGTVFYGARLVAGIGFLGSAPPGSGQESCFAEERGVVGEYGYQEVADDTVVEGVIVIDGLPSDGGCSAGEGTPCGTDADCCIGYACFPYSSPPVCAPSCATDLDCTDGRTCCVAFRPDFPFCDYVCLPS